MRKLIIVALCIGGLGAAANAQESVQQEDLTNANNEVICQRIPPPTGSRIGPRRICKTQNEWDRINRESRLVVEEAQSRSKMFQGN